MTYFIISVIAVSGVCALVYEILWGRMLMLVFGTSMPAVSTVLAAYMAGLALGSFLFGKLADRAKSPLRLYGFIELGTAAAAYAVPFLLNAATNIYIAAQGQWGAGPGAMTLIRFTVCFLILLPATTLIGGVLPVGISIVCRSIAKMGKQSGTVYAANVAGSVLGAFLCGFVLLRFWGMDMVNGMAVLLNACIGAGVLLYARFAEKTPYDASIAPDKTAPLGASRIVLLAMYCLSGFAALGYEVAWTRGLVFILGNRIYAFSTILAAFLAGLAIGSFAASRYADRSRRLLLVFGLLQSGIALAGIMSIPLINGLGGMQNFFYSHLSPGWGSYLLVKFVLAFVPLLVPTILMGATFPVITRAFVKDLHMAGSGVGSINAANTVGAIFGSVLAGFVIIPAAGIAGAITMLVAVNCAIALAAFLYTVRASGWQAARYSLPVLACVAAAAVAMPRQITLGRMAGRGERLFYEEGASATVAVFRNPATGQKRLEINGVNEVPTDMAAMRTFKLLGHLPLLLHENPGDVLMITFGGGIAAGSAACHPLATLDCVEICPGVIRAARACLGGENNRVLESSVLRMHIDDGRNFLLTAKRRYDVIISDATHPTSVDSWVLYTREFYRLCRSRLRDNGYFVQWVPLHNLTEQEYRSVLATFRTAFPNATLWLVGWDRGGGHSMLLGSCEPLHIDTAAVARRMERQGVRDDLARYGFGSTEDITRLMVLDAAGLERYAAGSPVNTDDFSFLALPQTPFAKESAEKKVRHILEARDGAGKRP